MGVLQGNAECDADNDESCSNSIYLNNYGSCNERAIALDSKKNDIGQLSRKVKYATFNEKAHGTVSSTSSIGLREAKEFMRCTLDSINDEGSHDDIRTRR